MSYSPISPKIAAAVARPACPPAIPPMSLRQETEMKRLHVHVSVDDLAQSTRFYSTLFAAEPTVVKDDYVKWMLEDPRGSLLRALNRAIGECSEMPHKSHSWPRQRIVGLIKKRPVARNLCAFELDVAATMRSGRRISSCSHRFVLTHPSAAIAGSVSLSSSVLASLRSAVSNPSVNQA